MRIWVYPLNPTYNSKNPGDRLASCLEMQGVWEEKTIAFAIRSVDRSLFVRLIPLGKEED